MFGTQPIKNIQKLDIDNTMQPKRAQMGSSSTLWSQEGQLEQ
jgi:hypothetical protein